MGSRAAAGRSAHGCRRTAAWLRHLALPPPPWGRVGVGVIRWVLRQSIQGKRARRQRHGSHIARVENLGQRAASAEPAFVQRVELLAPDARGDRQRYLFLVLAKMEHHEYLVVL